MPWVERELSAHLLRAARSFPAVVVTRGGSGAVRTVLPGVRTVGIEEFLTED